MKPIEGPLKQALNMGLVTDEFPCANFFNLDTLKEDVEHLQTSFEWIPNILHAVAVKANPVTGILEKCR